MGKVITLSERHSRYVPGTNELEETETFQRIRHDPEPEYVKVYVNAVGGIEGLSKSESALLYELALLVQYDGTIQLTPLTRRRILERVGITEKTFRNYMTTLVKQNILIRFSPNDYEANPNYFAKGKWKDIMQRQADFEMRIKFSKGKKPEVSTHEAPRGDS